ncbi:hypothetical protein ACSBLW_09890 [Thioclava sp. FR2]|uniref:hypothetical protein n=1 Tax=Thioclava sp. FR2 TaxID=3445780 RepID=UPI003EB8CC3D
MLPGFGLLRRGVTIGLCATAFWAGMQFERAIAPDRCLDSGGRYTVAGCEKGPAP